MDKKIKKLIHSDLIRYGVSDFRELSFMDRKELYGYNYMRIWRLTKYYKEQNKICRFIYHRLKLHRLSLKYGISIPYSTDIGPGFYIGHCGNIFVSGGAQIGSNVNLSQGVTIGYANGGKSKGYPKIGNNVWIGANSVVVGGIEIEDDVMIAPNTFVNFSVPSHSIVVSEKCAIKNKNDATEFYVQNRYLGESDE